jgi:hypothetical protein
MQGPAPLLRYCGVSTRSVIESRLTQHCKAAVSARCHIDSVGRSLRKSMDVQGHQSCIVSGTARLRYISSTCPVKVTQPEVTASESDD